MNQDFWNGLPKFEGGTAGRGGSPGFAPPVPDGGKPPVFPPTTPDEWTQHEKRFQSILDQFNAMPRQKDANGNELPVGWIATRDRLGQITGASLHPDYEMAARGLADIQRARGITQKADRPQYRFENRPNLETGKMETWKVQVDPNTGEMLGAPQYQYGYDDPAIARQIAQQQRQTALDAERTANNEATRNQNAYQFAAGEAERAQARRDKLDQLRKQYEYEVKKLYSPEVLPGAVNATNVAAAGKPVGKPYVFTPTDQQGYGGIQTQAAPDAQGNPGAISQTAGLQKIAFAAPDQSNISNYGGSNISQQEAAKRNINEQAAIAESDRLRNEGNINAYISTLRGHIQNGTLNTVAKDPTQRILLAQKLQRLNTDGSIDDVIRALLAGQARPETMTTPRFAGVR